MTRKQKAKGKGGTKKSRPEDARQSRTSIARVLGCSMSTIQRYVAMPDSPKPDRRGHYDLAEMRKFVTERAKWAVGGSGTPARERRDQKTQLEIEELTMKLDEKRRRLVRIEEIEPALEAFNAELLQNLETKFGQELPTKYGGRSVAECEAMNRDGVAWVLECLRRGQAPLRATQKTAQTQ